MSSSLIKNEFEQWVHTYLTVFSEPTYILQRGYNQYAAYEAWRRGLYKIPKPDNRTMAEEGWVSFVKGIQSMYEIQDFRAACSKAKEVIVYSHARRSPMDLWTELRRTVNEHEDKQAKKKAEELQCIRTATLDLLRKNLEDAKAKESKAHDDLWMAEANEEESTADYDRMKKEADKQENIMKEMIQARKDADKAYVAAQKDVEGAKKALELVFAAVEPTPTATAATTATPTATPTATAMIPSCNLPFTDNAFKPLKPCKATLKPGTYYIGDPCYHLGNSWIYNKAWDATAYSAPAYFHSDRGTLVVAHTAWGDGSYHEYHEEKGEKTREYLVDSATISIISHELIVDEVKRLAVEGTPRTFESLVKGGHIHTFDEGVDVHFKDGNFVFYTDYGGFNINTEGCETCREETEDEDMDE